MRRIVKAIALLISVILLASCKENAASSERVSLTSALDALKIDTQLYDWIVVLPGLGCHGCIQDGEYFMQQNVENPKIFYVLTNLSSLKIFQQKTGITIKDHPNIYVDRENLFVVPTNNSIYPCVIQLKEGQIAEHTAICPSFN